MTISGAANSSPAVDLDFRRNVLTTKHLTLAPGQFLGSMGRNPRWTAHRGGCVEKLSLQRVTISPQRTARKWV